MSTMVLKVQADLYGDGTAANLHLVDVAGNEIAVCHYCEGEYPPTLEEVEANAELIAKAVNCHDKFVEAIRDALALATCSQPPDTFVKCEAILQPMLDLVKTQDK